MGLFGQGKRTARVKAKTEYKVAELSYKQFVDLRKRDTRILFQFASQVVERLGNTTKEVVDLAFLDVTGRVPRTLLDLCNELDAMTHSDGMQIKVPRQEIGRIIGCSLEMVGRVLKTLQEHGHVSVKGKTIIV